MSKKLDERIERFQKDAAVIEETAEKFGNILFNETPGIEAFRTFKQHMTVLKEFDNDTFEQFKRVVTLLNNMIMDVELNPISSPSMNNPFTSDPWTKMPSPSWGIHSKTRYNSPDFPNTGFNSDLTYGMELPDIEAGMKAFNEEFKRAEEAFKQAEQHKTVESTTDELIATVEKINDSIKKEIESDSDSHEDAFEWNYQTENGSKYETVWYYPDTGECFGSVTGKFNPEIYMDGRVILRVKRTDTIEEKVSSRMFPVNQIIDESGAMPAPKNRPGKKNWSLIFENGNKLDLRLKNLIWAAGGRKRGKSSTDMEYNKRLIKDALLKHGMEQCPGAIAKYIVENKEYISVYMVRNLLPTVKAELEKEVKRNSPKEAIHFIEDWKKSLKSKYPTPKEIKDLKDYLAETGYINEEYSAMAIKNTISLLTGINLKIKDVL
jgi:hypothetical protein